ncbi:fibroblast growth factor receptor-like 1 [Stegodyphus dumicola]|uniref:fibroblast growth factor receptor-like 1 n=1 Tax=Stegodyphus dumicola TaxID=202533 RepID=UPI0015AF478A|nr:fibroblast growth factor receptor-like 1 [Stegodyphus dumicola]
MKTALSTFCFLLVANCLSYVSTQSPPQLNTNHAVQQHIVRPGMSTTLECPVRNSRDLIFEWYKDKESINTYPGQKMRILTNGALRIKETIFDDTGVYKCRAVNGFGSVEFNTTLLVIGSDEDYERYEDIYDSDDMDSDDSKISLTSKPRLLYVTNEESPVYKTPGSSFRFQCVATGYPKPVMTWYKDGIQVSRAFRVGRWALTFRNALSTDSGNYTCVATNLLGKASHSFVLVVDETKNHGIPLLIGSNTTVEEGEKAVMECGVKSSSFPHIEWLKQVDPNRQSADDAKSPIQMAGEYFNVLTTPYSIDYFVRDGIYYHKLIIENVQMEDAGKYVCLGANSYGYEYKFAYLEVLPRSGDFQASLPFPIVVTAIVVAVAVLGCIFALLVYCRPRRRSGSRGSSVAVPMVTKEDFIPMHPGPSNSSRCSIQANRSRSSQQHVTYVAGLTNGTV